MKTMWVDSNINTLLVRVTKEKDNVIYSLMKGMEGKPLLNISTNSIKGLENYTGEFPNPEEIIYTLLDEYIDKKLPSKTKERLGVKGNWSLFRNGDDTLTVEVGDTGWYFNSASYSLKLNWLDVHNLNNFIYGY